MKLSLHLRGVLALLVVAMVWGTTFPAMKLLTANLTPLAIIAWRFFISAVVLLWWTRQATSQEWLCGSVLGVILFLSYYAQVEGLQLTTSNRNAFITGLNVLMVPLLVRLWGRAIAWHIYVAAVVGIVGMALMFWDDAPWGWGESLTLLCAFFYAIYIVVLEAFSQRHVLHPFALTGVQSLWMFLLAITMALGTGQTLSPNVPLMLSGHWLHLLYLGVIAGALIIGLQMWAQRHVRAVEAALLYGLEPMFAAIVAWFWIGESLSSVALLGACLLVLAAIFGQYPSRPQPAALPSQPTQKEKP